MEASKQHRTAPFSRSESGRSVNAGGTLSAVGRLIERADALHLRAPELALVLGERAAALAEAASADEQWIRAESLVVSARVRVGDRPGTVGRAVAALRAAEHAGYGDIAARLRIDLAVCARSLGVPLTGLAALRPVLTDPVVSPVHRAAALCHLVGCLGQLGRKAELDRVLVEADKLVVGDDSLSADTQLLVRALLRVGTAAHRRRHGDLTAAADAARTGLGFLEKLDNPADDGGLVRIRLVLLLVSTLLDRGDAEMAYEIAEPVLAEPVRAAGVAPMGWLRLAVATRVHLPAGAGEAAIELVREAVASTDRHGLSAITARLWLELAQLQERFGQAEEAIACLYRSRAAEQLHARARRQACGVLAGEFGTGQPASVDLDEVLKAVPSRPVPVVAAEPVPEPEPEPRTPAWSFGRPRATADVAETTLMPAVRDEPAPQPGSRMRPEPIEVRAPEGRSGLGAPLASRPGRGAEQPESGEARPVFRPGAVETRSARGPELAEPRSAGRGAGLGPEYRPESGESAGRGPGYRPEVGESAGRGAARGPESGESAGRGAGQRPEYRPELAEPRSAERGVGPESEHRREFGESAGRGAAPELGGSAEREAGLGSEHRPEPVESAGRRRRPEPVEPPLAERGREPDFGSEPRGQRPEVRLEPGAEYRAELGARPAEPGVVRGAEPVERGPEVRSEPVEPRPAERDREPDFRSEPVEVRSATEAVETSPEAAPAEPGKTKFSWAALAEARLRETAAERESAPTRITPALPLAPEPAAEREPWASEGRRPEPQPSTRHDSEHGSEAARSVLDRLGISASGGAGGRRRAEDADRPRAEEPARPEPELAPPPRPEDEPPSVPDYRDEVEPWLPRLRMPPSLEPMEDFGHWTPATAPFPESYARAIAEDEPPPDAGLADLLARALAEHQAGTASAAALVKQLDSQNAGRRNGHGRNGHGAEVPDSRGHTSRD
ncbi:hypothetical protein AMES_6726 [Amycolatopsis mediterranei S699]|uniref:Uncharacterized protein n=3 Tax=Amycolatopsis mediterranei TaxID=33910 RepID=A0A0H3DE94_AMYMU|nr:hypothetical protein [Amycolatopsis mediterranei]ADJ48552.1 hypothetical protein AMED_6828 [Amycolatopsis mediterranei U32]AEK45481.1 hypothetical protein RAM_35040 [Amycolatopsis mediterranei S699]AFO80261.1 hypothetical protein AMES_6726 [Amycolatopsis mediterranei S699]KDO11057.1 hypothetical protein DV26_09475 [Amycolatopsis mediterranei]KDU88995.1 hypothetical protein DV36_27400 [Amycolatopsis mediterranei]